MGIIGLQQVRIRRLEIVAEPNLQSPNLVNQTLCYPIVSVPLDISLLLAIQVEVDMFPGRAGHNLRFDLAFFGDIKHGLHFRTTTQ